MAISRTAVSPSNDLCGWGDRETGEPSPTGPMSARLSETLSALMASARRSAAVSRLLAASEFASASRKAFNSTRDLGAPLDRCERESATRHCRPKSSEDEMSGLDPDRRGFVDELRFELGGMRVGIVEVDCRQ